MLTKVAGMFVKIAFASDADVFLARGQATRPVARFNRRGEDALYLSPDEISARVAMGQYVKPGDPPRVLIRYEVEQCDLFDLRHPDAASTYTLARQRWQDALARGEEPASWRAADEIRQAGHVGLIDPSRRRPGLWHITLMRWNEPGAPRVVPVGSPIPIEVDPGHR
ncbi:RES family NAD+ phosphorylase [Pelagibius sp. Alg239-R121]|uniref:RES family NAD+ phosphorylase n=1 Tax=Pelagibius sp. Alg239-R121 TaxID=2993448 RepID=UPI0024A6E454|nr:RES family NAD+ phosphorylase [Pelagibius sp. Alg239-R121]